MSETNIDAPYQHERWDDQVAFEREMYEEGRQRMQDRINKAKGKENMLGLRPHRSLIHEWVLPVSDVIRQFLDTYAPGKTAPRGPKPISLPCLRQLDPDVAALTALKAVLRMMGVNSRRLLSIAIEIGTNCEHEARMKHWQEVEPDEWRALQANFKRQHSTSVHQRRSTISIFNKYKHDDLGWVGWTVSERERVGLDLVDAVMRATRRFYLAEDPDWKPVRLKGGMYQHRPKVLMADAEMLQWINDAMDNELFHQPVFMPTLIPPLAWEGPRGGAYFTPFVKAPAIVRFRAHHEEVSQTALNDFESYDMPQAYEAINYVQDTAWTINKEVLAVVDTVWETDLALGKLIRQEPEPKPARPDLPKDDPAYKLWARKASEVNSRNARRVTEYLSQRRTILQARRLDEEPEFFFPHHFDFRGRMYPIPTDLTPQGNDLHRGLLTFAHGKPVDEDDAQWLAIQLANTWGEDKKPFGDRIEWVRSQRDRWLGIADDPLGDRSWAGLKNDNWQALAATLEWAKYLRTGPGMISSLPVRVDGTCNGIQHLSAMVRDEQGGRSVNLVPGNRPLDIYQEVADILTETLQANPNHELALKWLAVCGGRVPRDLTKRPVMILPYGGTKSAYFDYTMEWLKEADPYGDTIPSEERVKAVTYLVPYLLESVEGVVVRAMEVMDWIQKCCAITIKSGKPLTWTTPAGYVVRHFYAKQEVYRINCRLDGQAIFLRANRQTKALDPEGQLRGIAPNFVHSMDASALMSCVLLAKDNGINSITSIHDSYGTVAADMWKLERCLREAFVQTYQQPVLEQFREACMMMAGPDHDWPALPPMGSLDIEQIRQSDYFFA